MMCVPYIVVPVLWIKLSASVEISFFLGDFKDALLSSLRCRCSTSTANCILFSIIIIFEVEVKRYSIQLTVQ